MSDATTTATADGSTAVATQTAATTATTATTANNTPFYMELFKPDGGINKSAYEKLPEDIRYLKDGLSKYENAEQFFRGIANQQTLAGKKGLIPLAENAPPEARAERKALLDSINGVPKEAKDYGITKPADMPDAQWNPKLAEGYSNWAHKWSVSPSAARELVATQLESVKTQLAAQAQYEADFFTAHAKRFAETIRTENVPEAKANALAERAATALGFDLQNPEDQMLMKNSKVRLAMMRHALSTGEDQFVSGDAPQGNADAFTQAKDIMHNKTNPLYAPLYDSKHPQHQQAKAKVDQLLRSSAVKAAS